MIEFDVPVIVESFWFLEAATVDFALDQRSNSALPPEASSGNFCRE